MCEQWITITDDARIRTITFNRPERRNALTPEMLDRLAHALDLGQPGQGGGHLAHKGDATNKSQTGQTPALPEPIGCVLVQGEGKVFCAGFDLSLCKDSPDGSVMRSLLTTLDKAAKAMRACPVPVVVACQGAAIAGGCALVAASDIAIADRNARLGYPVVLLGISPAVSAPTLIPRIGPGSARSRMLDPGLLPGEQALQTGLVHELVEQATDVPLRAKEVAAAIASKPARAMAATKHWLNTLEQSDPPLQRSDRDHPDLETGSDGLAVSLNLTGSVEEQNLLGAYWIHRESK